MIGVLTMIAVLSGAALGFTDLMTRDRIEANRIERQMAAVRQVLPVYANDPGQEQWAYPERSAHIVFPGRDEEGSLSGLAVQARVGSGYAGDITAVTGFDMDGSITRVVVLQHAETPGLGARIIEQDFTSQFQGVQPDDSQPRLARRGGQIDAITAATVSSEAVVELVRRAGEVFREYLAEYQEDTDE